MAASSILHEFIAIDEGHATLLPINERDQSASGNRATYSLSTETGFSSDIITAARNSTSRWAAR